MRYAKSHPYHWGFYINCRRVLVTLSRYTIASANCLSTASSSISFLRKYSSFKGSLFEKLWLELHPRKDALSPFIYLCPSLSHTTFQNGRDLFSVRKEQIPDWKWFEKWSHSTQNMNSIVLIIHSGTTWSITLEPFLPSPTCPMAPGLPSNWNRALWPCALIFWQGHTSSLYSQLTHPLLLGFLTEQLLDCSVMPTSIYWVSLVLCVTSWVPWEADTENEFSMQEIY